MMDEYLASARDREFHYGAWDCLHFVVGLYERSWPEIHMRFRAWKEYTGYKNVVDAASYKAWLASRTGLTTAEDFADQLTATLPFERVAKPQHTDIALTPRRQFALVDRDLQGVFPIAPKGLLRHPLPRRTIYMRLRRG